MVRRHGEHAAPCHDDTPYRKVGQTTVQSSTTLRGTQSSRISGIRLISGSVKTSFSSVLVLENSEMTAPSGPD